MLRLMMRPEHPDELTHFPYGITELSKHLLGVFNEGLFPDVDFAIGSSQVAAHRLVLSRNPRLRFDGANSRRFELPQQVPEWALQQALRAHYLEGVADEDGPVGMLAALQFGLPAEEWQPLRDLFGTATDVKDWLPLKEALRAMRFCDCTVRLRSGVEFPAHRFILVGAGADETYFNGFLFWPGERSYTLAGDTEKSGPSRPSIAMPGSEPGDVVLSDEGALALLHLRYGGAGIDYDVLMEAQYYAEYLQWKNVEEGCMLRIQDLLARSDRYDTTLAMELMSQAASGDVYVPDWLRQATFESAVRNWPRIEAELEKPSKQGFMGDADRMELKMLHRICNREGHVPVKLEDYLQSFADDLLDWEYRNQTGNGPKPPRESVAKKLQRGWWLWDYFLKFDYGKLAGRSAATDLRERVMARARRRCAEAVAERQCKDQAGPQVPPGKVLWEPDSSQQWQEVPPNAICPVDLEYRVDEESGKTYARWLRSESGGGEERPLPPPGGDAATWRAETPPLAAPGASSAGDAGGCGVAASREPEDALPEEEAPAAEEASAAGGAKAGKKPGRRKRK